jgi:hypothetical protein
MTMATSKMAVPARKGKRDGVVTELSCFFKVLPGREEHIRKACEEADRNPLRLATLERVGTLTEARLVIFDNGTRFGFFTVFEGEWDRYIEDFVPGVIPAMDKIFRDNVEGWLTKPLAESTVDEIKAALDAAQVTAAGLVWMHKEHTLKQIRKALRVNDAFQKVLDNPDAAKALEHPALQPLLAEAAD